MRPVSRRWLAAGVGAATVGAALPVKPAAAEEIYVRKGELVINVNDYASIQAALDKAPPGSTVLIPPGIYKLTASLSVPDRITLQGSGWGSRLEVAADSTVISRENAVGVHIRDLGCRNTATTDQLSTGLIDFNGGNDCHIENCHLIGGRYGVRIVDQERSYVVDNTITGQNGKFATAGVFIASITGRLRGCLVKGNRIYDVTNGMGIFADVEFWDGDINAELQIIGNHVRDVTDNGIRFQTLSETETTTHVQGGYVIADNVVESVGVNGIRINGHHAVVSGNYVISPVGSGIRDGGGGQDTKWTVVRHASIADNIVRDAGSAGIILQNASYGNSITGNTVSNAGSYGIMLGERYGGKVGASDTTITGNLIDGFKNDGIMLTGGVSSGIRDIVVANNVVHGSTAERDGISVRNTAASGLTISGNRCRGMQYGAWISSTTTAVVGNNFAGCVNPPSLGGGGAGNQVGLNIV